MFFDRYSSLCKTKGKSPTGVALELNVSRATVNYWKNGNVPKQKILIKIADYFNVSVDYLLGNEKSPADNGEALKTFDTKRYTVFAKDGIPGAHTVVTNNKQMEKMSDLLEAIQDLSPEKIDMLIKMAESIK